MNISDIINKSSPLYKQKEMSKSEYKKLVDRNTELIDKIKDVREFVERYLKLNLDAFDTRSLLEKILEILNGDDKNE